MEDKTIIREFSFTPKANKKRAMPPLFLSAALCGVLLILASSAERYGGLLSLGSAISLTAALYFYARYIGTHYTYSVIINTNDEPVFLVNKIAGKRSSLMFMGYLFDAEGIQKFTKNGASRYSKPKNKQKYNFTATLGIKEFYVISFKSARVSSEVLLEIDDECASTLDLHIKEAKKQYREED